MTIKQIETIERNWPTCGESCTYCGLDYYQKKNPLILLEYDDGSDELICLLCLEHEGILTN